MFGLMGAITPLQKAYGKKALIPFTDGRNVRIGTRWTAADADRGRRYAAELVALAPDVILVSGGTVVGMLLQASRTVPIVFTLTVDLVGAASLARPGGSATGFTQWDRFHSSFCRETPPWFTPTERPGPLAPSGGPGLAQRTGSGGALCQFHSYQNA
jgi:hypothetical protein